MAFARKVTTPATFARGRWWLPQCRRNVRRTPGNGGGCQLDAATGSGRPGKHSRATRTNRGRGWPGRASVPGWQPPSSRLSDGQATAVVLEHDASRPPVADPPAAVSGSLGHPHATQGKPVRAVALVPRPEGVVASVVWEFKPEGWRVRWFPVERPRSARSSKTAPRWRACADRASSSAGSTAPTSGPPAGRYGSLGAERAEAYTRSPTAMRAGWPS